jgi:secondary thiamine-phosphate synthase enzyme
MNIEKIEKKLNTEKRLQIIDITTQAEEIINSSEVSSGILTLWVPHTTACITINENDSNLWQDMLNRYKDLVPLEKNYLHPKNAHAHILSSIIKPELQIPVIERKMTLGTWQRILFIELDGLRQRKLIYTIMY